MNKELKPEKMRLKFKDMKEGDVVIGHTGKAVYYIDAIRRGLFRCRCLPPKKLLTVEILTTHPKGYYVGNVCEEEMDDERTVYRFT